MHGPGALQGQDEQDHVSSIMCSSSGMPSGSEAHACFCVLSMHRMRTCSQRTETHKHTHACRWRAARMSASWRRSAALMRNV